MKFGKWTVIKFDHCNKHRIKYFLCKCECGTIRPVRATALTNGLSTSCSEKCSLGLSIGDIFGEWTVLGKDKSRPRYYMCKCSCGTIKSVYEGSLKQGTSKSCDHVKKDRFRKNAELLVGQKYGLLTVQDIELKGDQYYCRCLCDCGNAIIVKGTALRCGQIVSCGCAKSKANVNMGLILTKLSIPFKREYCFKDCKDKRPLPFDFALFNNEEELIGLIENNGQQHYSARGTGWNTPERLIYTQKHDYIKQKFAEDNKIPLLIIPYQYFDELEKFLTTSDFWQIIIKNFND